MPFDHHAAPRIRADGADETDETDDTGHGIEGADQVSESEAAQLVAVERLRRVTGNLPAGEARPQQVKMCRAVAGAVEGGRHLVVQAGTGTGKSLGYLVPAALSGRKVVVATATKALQDQLAGKDLPLVAANLGQPLSYAVLKGRSNYLCRQRAGEIDGGVIQPGLDSSDSEAQTETDTETPGEWVTPADSTPEDRRKAEDPGRLADQVRRILDWAADSGTGDRADLPFEPSERAWGMLSVGPRECPGAFRCPSGHHCFAEDARARAASADVIVVNTHLYGSHLASGGVVLPAHDVVVFDEAHEVEEVMTASLGVELSPGRFRALVALSRPLMRDQRDRDLIEGLFELGERLGSLLTVNRGTRVLVTATTATPDGESRSRFSRPIGAGSTSGFGRGPDQPGEPEPAGRERTLNPPLPRRSSSQAVTATGGSDGAGLEDLLNLAASRVQEVMAALRRSTEVELTFDIGGAIGAGGGGGTPDDRGRQARALSAAGHLADDLARFAARTDDEVAWVDDSLRSPTLHLSPIDVGPPLAGVLWGEVTAVLTSATIPPRLSERLGLSAFPVDELDVGSPFNYREHGLLYVARHLPDRRSPDAEPALHDELAALIEAAGGRTLALFTSRRATESAVTVLRERLPYRLLVQGELPKGRLLATFAEDEESCLFATLGFWQGVDVPGRALSLVTVDKLPFARPDDPLLEARRERAGEAAFRLVDLPRAATLMAQGAGRLIRTSEDRGVVAVLDPRLATAGYRAVLLAAMPPMRRTTDRRNVVDFLHRVLG